MLRAPSALSRVRGPFSCANLLPQTYYLTVDLSLPEFVYRNPSGIIHFGRGGYFADYINDPGSGHRRSMAHRVERPGGKMTDDEDEDDESLPEREDDLDEEEPDLMPPRAQDGSTEVADDKLVARDIEILDLHTEHPIISYRGKVFEGSWAEVLGTEMIFAEPDAAAPLPALRTLPGNVDLLAASSARILTTEKVLTIPEELDRLRATREAYGISLPVLGKHRIDERKRQVRFLENLMALKMKRGERDQVTVVAKPAADKDFQDDRDPNFMPRRARTRFPGQGHRAAGGEQGRKSLPAGRTEAVAGSGRGADAVDAGGSVPTPGTWSDILPGEEVEEYVEGDEEEGEGEHEDDDGDVAMGASP